MGQKAENTRSEMLELISTRIVDEAAARAALAEAEATTDSAVVSARENDISWADIAGALSEPPQRARWRAQRAQRPGYRPRRTRAVQGIEGEPSAKLSAPPGTVTISRAAELLKLRTPSLVYELVSKEEEPRLKEVITPSGLSRITLDSIAQYLGVDVSELEEAAAPLPVSQVAERLGVSRNVVYRLIENELLEVQEGWSPVRVLPSSLDEYLQRSTDQVEGMSVSAAAERLGISRHSVNRLLEQGGDKGLEEVTFPGRARQVSFGSVQRLLDREARLDGWPTVSEAARKYGLPRRAVLTAVEDSSVPTEEDAHGKTRINPVRLREWVVGRGLRNES